MRGEITDGSPLPFLPPTTFSVPFVCVFVSVCLTAHACHLCAEARGQCWVASFIALHLPFRDRVFLSFLFIVAG